MLTKKRTEKTALLIILVIKMYYLRSRGISSAVLDWPDRSKNWFYAYGGRLNPEDGTLIIPPTLREKAATIMQKLKMSKREELRLTERLMNSLWHSGTQNTQDDAEATGSCHGSLLSSETGTPIEAAKEEDSAKSNSGEK